MQRQACKLVGYPAWKWGGDKDKLMLIGDCICNRISLGSLMKARRPFAGSFAKAVLGPWPVMRCSRPCRRCFQERLAHGADGLEAVGAGLNTCMIDYTYINKYIHDWKITSLGAGDQPDAIKKVWSVRRLSPSTACRVPRRYPIGAYWP